jgi:hypothetical protein
MFFEHLWITSNSQRSPQACSVRKRNLRVLYIEEESREIHL